MERDQISGEPFDVTTNGTLLSQSMLAALAGVLGQVRLSIYDDIEWRRAAAMLAGAGQLFGANVLVSDARLPRLPALLAELAQFSCHDVSLLNYVGSDPRLHLSSAGTDVADAYIAELLPGYSPGDQYRAPWKELFQRERVDSPDLAYGEMPDSLVAIQRSVVARGYAADDAFPDLRTLAWKRGADVLPSGVHVHEGTTALFVARCRDKTDAAALVAQLPHPKARTYRHGDYALGVMLLKDACEDPGVHGRGYGPARDTRPTAMVNIKRIVAEWAGGRPLSFELYFDAVEEAEFVHAKQALGGPPQSESRGVAWFYGSEAERLAHTLSEDATVIRSWRIDWRQSASERSLAGDHGNRLTGVRTSPQRASPVERAS